MIADFFAFFGKLVDAIMQKLYPMHSTDNLDPEQPYIPASVPPIKTPDRGTNGGEVLPDSNKEVNVPVEANSGLLWATPKQAWHSVRVLCDEEGLSKSEKDLICAVIYQESEFKNGAVCRNKDKKGNILSSDWGICQINDYWHCGKGKTFPNAEYVVANPEEAVKFMLKMYRLGLLKLWVGFSSKAYERWLSPNSPMWKLKS